MLISNLLFVAAINQLSLGGRQIFVETIDPNSQKVKLLTTHAAKGSEFRYVSIMTPLLNIFITPNGCS
jgi:superfamily I DNA/RNA helicase